MPPPIDPLSGPLSDPMGSNAAAVKERKEATRRIKKLACDLWDLSDETSVFVAELQCGETDCPDTETVIAVFLEGERREFRVNKPITELTRDDLVKCSGD